LVAGCTTTVSVGAGEPRTYPDGAMIVPCGPVDCAPGKVCCSTTCGLCTASGACPVPPAYCPAGSLNCAPDPVSLTGEQTCMHWVWNGLDCVAATGCTCSGSCDVLTNSYVECMDAHTICWPHVCDVASPCPTGYFCGRASCASTSGVCTLTPTIDCATTPHLATCGCDGFSYRSVCDAQRAGQSSPDAPTCGACTAPELTITSGCSTPLGWSWDGLQCIERTGCACAGACDELEPTEAACRARFESACASVFPCGQTSCRRGTEFCLLGTNAGLCQTIPAACPRPDCACVLSLDLGATACTEDASGDITATTF
jgi:hypothetical protein